MEIYDQGSNSIQQLCEDADDILDRLDENS